MLKIPPSQLLDPNIYVLAKDTKVHRVHDRNYVGNSFNPSDQKQSRFSPIWDSEGRVIPVLYATNSIEVAICETLFHDIQPHLEVKNVEYSDIAIINHTVLKVTKDIQLAMLRNSDLKKWNIGRDELIHSTPDQYDRTAKWAEAINRQFPLVDGLIWTSNQCDPDDAYMFFGNRVSANIFDTLEVRNGLTDVSLVNDIVNFGKRSNIEVRT